MQIEMSSNKPYIVRAFYDWISDNGLTPYILVDANVPGVLVPMAFVNDGQIVLNISGGAVGSIAMGGNAIEFSARFGGKLENLVVPYGAVGAIYAKENGAGTSLAIEVPSEEELAEETNSGLAAISDETEAKDSTEGGSDEKPKKKGKPSLSIVK